MVSGCIFCKILEGELPVSKVYEDAYVLAFMDLYPMLPGHVLIIPKQHHVSIQGLTPAFRSHLFETGTAVALAQMSTDSPQAKLDCAAHNFFINDGPPANQHVPHVHLHVLPRAGGDLHKAFLSFASRYNNFFGVSAKRKRLDALAKNIAIHMPKQVESPLVEEC